ncbi:hypothetical protein [Albidovulum sediminis]|uniref:Uncharacterized protein n=1 Tax=Albidovulum sediminis TaxID=3066345 RepID=A0ABT2NRF1_9RHOB|nr:hypothetical protein [Defluviimonas sediminis]MCT8330154.1 hypothetical protein [Defluviimonas sediminis]
MDDLSDLGYREVLRAMQQGKAMQKKRKSLLLLITTSLMAVIGWAAIKHQHMLTERRAIAELAEQERLKLEEDTRREEDLARRKAANARLLAMTDRDIKDVGLLCVSLIAREMDGSSKWGWSFVDVNPREFGGIGTSSLMGLSLTAAGSEITGAELVDAQVDWVRQIYFFDYNTYARMEFVISKRVDSFSGIKEILALYECDFSSVDNATVREADRIPLN